MPYAPSLKKFFPKAFCSSQSKKTKQMNLSLTKTIKLNLNFVHLKFFHLNFHLLKSCESLPGSVWPETKTKRSSHRTVLNQFHHHRSFYQELKKKPRE